MSEKTTSIRWRKSSYSGGEGGSCVEVGDAAPTVAIRDTKNRTGPALSFTRREFKRMVTRIKGGELDL